MPKKLGILLLDTIFHRPMGDIGNPSTFPFPVDYKIVEGAMISRIVKQDTEMSVIDSFVAAGKELEKQGVKAIATSCGFLAIYQKEIQQQLHVPFISSSLLQIPFIYLTAGGPIGVVTASKASLTNKHLEGVDALDHPLVIRGMDDMPAFRGAIIDEEIPLNQSKVLDEMKQVTSALIKDFPELRAIVLECTNMPPYREAMRQVTNIPIYDMNTLIHYVYHTIE